MKEIIYFVVKKESGLITYYVANDLDHALSIYQREKTPLVQKYGVNIGYAWDNRELENGSKVETLSSYRDDLAYLSVSTEKTTEDLDFYTMMHDMSQTKYTIVDERSE